MDITPACIPLPRLRLPKLASSQFIATKFSSAAEKADFGNRLLAFLAEGFPKSRFTKGFYNRLSLTFGHIAHYNLDGFWHTFFTTTVGRIDFIADSDGLRTAIPTEGGH